MSRDVAIAIAGLLAGALLGRIATRPEPEPIADRWATSEAADAGQSAVSPRQPRPPADAGVRVDLGPVKVQLESLDSIVGEWTSATGEPSPEATIRIVSDDPDEPRWKFKAWGESQWFVGCDVYRSLKAYCKLYDAKHRDVPLSLRGVQVGAAIHGGFGLVLSFDGWESLTLRRGSVASGRRAE